MTTATAEQKLQQARQTYQARKAEEQEALNTWCNKYKQVIMREERNGLKYPETHKIAEAETKSYQTAWEKAQKRSQTASGLITRYYNLVEASK